MDDLSLGTGAMRDLARLRDFASLRVSSWDRTGGNKDYIEVPPGTVAELLSVKGPGCIVHIWLTFTCQERAALRKCVFRTFWDGEASPSVDVPVGDFFGMGHARTRNFTSAPLSMGPQDGQGLNCYFPMPFLTHARVEFANECDVATASLYYHIDLEEYPTLEPRLGRFHAQWRREQTIPAEPIKGLTNAEIQGWNLERGEPPVSAGVNLDGRDNYVILDAKGRGKYVGCNLNIVNRRVTDKWNWYGEGDDMIFIDGDTWPPSMHGTGTEDYFGTAMSPRQEFMGPYYGILLPGGSNWEGMITLYRYHILDPVYFSRSIRVTIEHGHANRRWDDYSSTAYWYQAEPHVPLPPLPPAERRLP